MGVELTLYFDVDKHINSKIDYIYCFNKLSFDRDKKLFNSIKKDCIAHPVLKSFKFETYKGLEMTQIDHYGALLTYVNVGSFKKISQKGLSKWNKAIFRLIDSLDDDFKIVLYYH